MVELFYVVNNIITKCYYCLHKCHLKKHVRHLSLAVIQTTKKSQEILLLMSFKMLVNCPEMPYINATNELISLISFQAHSYGIKKAV